MKIVHYPECLRALSRSATLLIVCGTAVFGGGCLGDSFSWETATPESEGIDPQRFAAFADSVQERRTEALMVIVNDRVIHEWYAPGRSPRRRHYTASMQKGLTAGLATALLLDDGRISLDEPAANYVVEWQEHSRKSDVSVRHLLTHSSGLEGANVPGVPKDALTGWKGAFWRRDSLWNPPKVTIENAEALTPPGTRFFYNNAGIAVASYVLSAALDDTKHSSLRTYLRTRLFRPVGIRDDRWSMGYGRPIDVNGIEVWGTWGGGSFTPRALARIGRLLLRRGDWDGEGLLSGDAIERVTGYGGTPVFELADSGQGSSLVSEWTLGAPAPGLGWWNNATLVWPGLPRDAFAAVGAEHQVLLVVPSLNLIVVRVGGDLRHEDEDVPVWEALARHFMSPLARSVGVPSPQWSSAIGGMWFEPLSNTVCEAVGSDNWPITWLGDGTLLASYGDGWGFEPRIDEKLSLGLAEIPGSPTNPEGQNFRSPSGELRGDGPAGGKASGILDVDGVVYMWVRNRENSQIAWSTDRGRTWTWGFRFQESFGSPTFLQFGPGYRDARDEYVYTVSQDGPSAYEPDEQLVLARVRRDSVQFRDGYEFFAGVNGSGGARWSRDINQRAPVLENVPGVERSEIVYNAALQRYLLALGFDHGGAWGVFDAPEPWGPWTTVFATARWDVGATHSYRIPTKWIESAGKSLYVVFSGRDRPGQIADGFCVRRASLLPVIAPMRRDSIGH